MRDEACIEIYIGKSSYLFEEKKNDWCKKYSESVRQKYFYPGKKSYPLTFVGPFWQTISAKTESHKSSEVGSVTDEMRRTEQERRKKKKKAHNSNRF